MIRRRDSEALFVSLNLPGGYLIGAATAKVMKPQIPGTRIIAEDEVGVPQGQPGVGESGMCFLLFITVGARDGFGGTRLYFFLSTTVISCLPNGTAMDNLGADLEVYQSHAAYRDRRE